MIILGIETSCDDTSVAIVEDGCEIRANCVAGQDDFHRRFGGIVPEIAARKHLENLLPTIHLALDQAQISIDAIDAFAVTHRPGLIGSLIVGLTSAKVLASIYNRPLIALNHIEAHAFASCFAGVKYGQEHISLVASGGHTSILHIRGNTLNLIGRTVDDAAGEAFDKVAKSLGLGFPGGPIIDRCARNGNPSAVHFPRPMIDHPGFDFSFSGLKTAVLYHLHNNPNTQQADLAASFQEAVVDVLVEKTLRAAKHWKVNRIAVVGGVACNSRLRSVFSTACDLSKIALFIPNPSLCTDNAAMVAGLAWHKLTSGFQSSLTVGPDPNSGLTRQVV